MVKLTLPTDSTARKDYSLSRGCYSYAPAALAGVAKHSYKAGAKHTNGELVHKRWLSDDHEDCIERHLADLRDILAFIARNPTAFANPDPDSLEVRMLLDEANALAWRALVFSQILHEKYAGAPLAPAARVLEAEPKAQAQSVFASSLVRDARCATRCDEEQGPLGGIR